MTIRNIPTPSWRNEPGIMSVNRYKKCFALFPVTCSDGKKVWFETYYSKYIISGNDIINSTNYTGGEIHLHSDFVENITEAEYLVRRLSESL